MSAKSCCNTVGRKPAPAGNLVAIVIGGTAAVGTLATNATIATTACKI